MVEEDVALALQRLQNRIHSDYWQSTFATLYPFTTENIRGYMSSLDLTDKKVLTIGSSGDQILNAILYGAEDLTCFDKNRFVPYYYELKKTALLMLSREEFLDFLSLRQNPNTFRDNANAFAYSTYRQLRPMLEEETRYFWDQLYWKTSGSLIRNRLFNIEEYRGTILQKINGYLEDDAYEQLKEKVSKATVQFLCCEMKELSCHLKQSYDVVFLSNVLGYEIEETESKESLENWLLPLVDHTTKDGLIYLAYLYNVNAQQDPILTQKKERQLRKLKEVFSFTVLQENLIDGVFYPQDPLDQDLTVVYQKKSDRNFTILPPCG